MPAGSSSSHYSKQTYLKEEIKSDFVKKGANTLLLTKKLKNL
jgi:hypothetical protein